MGRVGLHGQIAVRRSKLGHGVQDFAPHFDLGGLTSNGASGNSRAENAFEAGHGGFGQ